MTSKKKWMEKLRQSKRGFCCLCRALTELHYAMSFPSLILLLMRLLSTAFCLYATLYGLFVSDNRLVQKLAPGMASIALVGLVGMLILLRAADLPSHQVVGDYSNLLST